MCACALEDKSKKRDYPKTKNLNDSKYIFQYFQCDCQIFQRLKIEIFCDTMQLQLQCLILFWKVKGLLFSATDFEIFSVWLPVTFVQRMLLSAMLLSWLSGKVSNHHDSDNHHDDNDVNSNNAPELVVRKNLIMMMMKLAAVLREHENWPDVCFNTFSHLMTTFCVIHNFLDHLTFWFVSLES